MSRTGNASTSTETTLVGFLLARIAERKRNADMDENVGHISGREYGRVIVECEALRRVVEHCVTQAQYLDTPADAVTTIRLLALPYADHKDYRRDEWKP